MGKAYNNSKKVTESKRERQECHELCIFRDFANQLCSGVLFYIPLCLHAGKKIYRKLALYVIVRCQWNLESWIWYVVHPD